MKLTHIWKLPVVCLLAACSQDTEQTPQEPVEIRFTTSIESIATRGAETYATVQTTQFESGSVIALHVTDPSNTFTYNSRFYTADGSGGLRLSQKSELGADANNLELDLTAMYYPPTKDGTVMVHAAYPGRFDGKDKPTESGYTFTVDEDQSSMTKDAYKRFDLMYGAYWVNDKPATVDRAAEGNAIPLTFKHLMTKIVINVTKDANNSSSSLDVSNCTITLKNMQREVKFTYNDNGGAATANGQTSDITVIKTGNNKASGTAIVPPQSKTGEFIQITLKDGATCEPYSITTTFEGGKIYTYNIKVGLQSISVSTLVQDWTTVAAVSGSVGLTN